MKILVPITIALSIIVGVVLGRFFFAEFLKSEDPAQVVHIRVVNQTGMTITKLWIGADSGTYFKDLKPGKDAAYRSFKPELAAYRKVNFITEDGKKYLDTINPENFIGQAELSKGKYYTFQYKIEGDKAILDLKEDTQP
jgi:hypothetical protein